MRGDVELAGDPLDLVKRTYCRFLPRSRLNLGLPRGRALDLPSGRSPAGQSPGRGRVTCSRELSLPGTLSREQRAPEAHRLGGVWTGSGPRRYTLT